MKHTERDSQKSRLHAAEDAVETRHASFIYADFETAQSFLDRVIRTRWFRARWPHVCASGCVLKPMQMNANAVQSGWGWEQTMTRRNRFSVSLFPVIEIPLFALRSSTILHCLAHVVSGCETHSREFARAFLQITRHCLTRERGRELLDAYRQHRVHHHRLRRLTEAQREQARETARKYLVKSPERKENLS